MVQIRLGADFGNKSANIGKAVVTGEDEHALDEADRMAWNCAERMTHEEIFDSIRSAMVKE